MENKIDLKSKIREVPNWPKEGVNFKDVTTLLQDGDLLIETIEKEYTLEYASNTIQMHKDAVLPGENVVWIDDLCATGGTALASCDLIEELGGKLVGIYFVVDLPFLEGSKKLKDRGYEVKSLVEYDHE